MLEAPKSKIKKSRSDESLDAIAAIVFVAIFVIGMYFWLDSMP